MKKYLFILALILCVIIPVSAETLTGTITSNGDYEQTSCNFHAFGATTDVLNASVLRLVDAEYLTTLVSVVRWDASRTGDDYVKFRTSNPTISGEATPFIGTIGSQQVVTGTIGYQRYWDALKVEQVGYQYLVFNTWNLTGITGTAYLNLSYDHSAIHNMYYEGFYDNCPTTLPTGYLNFRAGTTLPYGDQNVRGHYYWLKYDSFTNSYTVTSPSQLGISGSVDKEGYSSKIYIVNATSMQPIISEYTVSTTGYNFTTVRQPIYISALSSLGIVYNSTVLFSDASVIPTWTPDPNVTPAPGYVRTYFQNVDGRTSGAIYNSDIKLQNVQTGAWTNYTADSDGTGYIDTLPNQTINGYGSKTGYVSTSRTNLGAFSEGIYELIMFPTNAFPTPSAGNVTLIVIVNDKTTALPISSAQVRVTIPSGATYTGTTGASGQTSFTVPNSSASYIGASKSGYNSANEYVTTTAFGPDTVRIELSKTVLNPTVTMTPGPGGTVPPTLQPGQNPDGSYQSGYSTLQGQNMLNWLAANGMGLVQLCFFVTVLALLGVKFGK